MDRFCAQRGIQGIYTGETMMSTDAPLGVLDSYKILDFTQYVAGPTVTDGWYRFVGRRYRPLDLDVRGEQWWHHRELLRESFECSAIHRLPHE